MPPLSGVPVGFSLGGLYMCAELGGGREVVCDRQALGPWETWTVKKLDAEQVSIQASTGHYLCAELDGSVIANRTRLGAWERWTIHLHDGCVAFQSAHGKFLCAESGGGGPVVANRTAIGPWESFTPSNMDWWHPVCARPLIGPLRIENKLFRDDTGYRRVLFCSWFPALRILRDDPVEFERQLNAITSAGYQGIRVFLAVGGWTPYWDGREVAPIGFTKWVFTGNHLRTDQYGPPVDAWPDYDALLRTLLQKCRARKLRLHVCCGDMQILCPDPGFELDLHARFAQICAEEGGLEVIALAETTNEFPLNRYGGDSHPSIEQMGLILRVWTDAIPGVLTAQGAIPQNEEPESLALASTYGDVCAVHVTRSPFEMALKRTLGLVYWEGDYRAFPKPFWEGEPAGPGDDSYQRLDDPASLTALYAMHALTGQASVQFSGPAVRAREPLESVWGFTELPAILANIPEDIATWNHASNRRGGIEYFFKGKDFQTATHENWDTSPPQPIAEWTLYAGTGVTTGTGTPPRATGYVVGRFV